MSVIIPTFNRAYIVGTAIESVLAQTYPEIEIIIIDDGSTDDTADVVARFVATQPRRDIRYVRQPNGGVCRARNTGLAMARGEFVALLDSDDAWLPWKLDAQVGVLRALPEAGMVWSDMIAVGADGKEIHPTHLRTMYSAHSKICIAEVMRNVGQVVSFCPAVPDESKPRPVLYGDIFSEMMLGNLVHTSTVLVRRERLRQVGPFDVGLRRSGEDYEFHLRTAFYGPVAFMDVSTIRYRVGASDQLTSPAYSVDIARNNLTTLRRWLAYGRHRLSLDPVRMRSHLAEACAWLGHAELMRNHRSAAAGHLLTGLVMEPRPTTLAHLLLCIVPASLVPALRGAKQRVKRLAVRSNEGIPPPASGNACGCSAPSPVPLRMQLVVDEAGLQRLAGDWEGMLGRAERPNPMLSPAWALTWWQHYHAGRSLAVGAFYRGDVLVGLAPFCRRSFKYSGGLSFRRLEIMGCSGGEADGVCGEYLGVLAELGCENEVAEACARELSRGSFGAWDEIVIELMDGQSAMTTALEQSLGLIGLVSSHVDMAAYYLPLPKDWSQFLQGVNTKRRTWFRREWKGFLTWIDGRSYALERTTSPDKIADHMRVLADLHGERWRADGKEGAFASPRFTAFHQGLSRQLLDRGQLDLMRLTVAGKPVAALYSFLADNKIYFYQSGRIMSGIPRDFSIGIVMIMLAIQDAMKRGIAEWDFLGGSSSYKSRFTRLTRPLVTLRVARPGWRETARRGLYAVGRGTKWLLRRSATVKAEANPKNRAEIRDDMQDSNE